MALYPYQQFNGLSPAEHERLTILFEEMAEATQIVGKILRHGPLSYNPTVPNSPINRTLLETEVGHVMYAIDMLVRAGDLEQHNLSESYKRKSESIHKYLHHQTPTYNPHTWERRVGYKVCTKCHLSDVYLGNKNGVPECTVR